MDPVVIMGCGIQACGLGTNKQVCNNDIPGKNSMPQMFSLAPSKNIQTRESSAEHLSACNHIYTPSEEVDIRSEKN